MAFLLNQQPYIAFLYILKTKTIVTIIQYSVLGQIKAKLKNGKRVFVIDKFQPTTKCCYVCGNMIDIKVSERTFNCECGLSEDRDIKAAKTILKFGQMKLDLISTVPTEHREFKPVEKAATDSRNTVKQSSVNQEAII